MSIPSSAIREASICLRCQYRLSLRRKPKLRQPPLTPHQIRHFGLGRGLHQEQTPIKDVDSYDEGSSTISNAPPQPDITVTYVPWKNPARVLSFRKPTPPKDSLGFVSLGQPAEVLILKDQREREELDRYYRDVRSSETDADPPAESLSSSKMLEEMNAERGIIGIDQVCKNIDAAKEEWMKDSAQSKLPWENTASVVTKRQYEEVASRLNKSFTTSQLAAYLYRNEDIEKLDPLDLHNQYRSNLYTRSSWKPGTTEIWQSRAPEVASIVRGSIGAKFETSEKHATKKGNLTDRILRSCWRIRPREDEKSIGEMDIRLHAEHLNLIINHQRGILKQMSETYGAKVEASSRDQAIRVTSDHDTCLDILKLIIHTLGNIKISVIDLPATLKGVPRSTNSADKDSYQDAIIAQVMQLTNTIIREVSGPQKRRLNIFYLGPDDDDLQDARRMISQILLIKPAKERRLLMSTAIRQNRDILVPIDVGTSLPLTERAQHWSRWCSRSTRQVDLMKQREGAPVLLNTLENPLNRKAITSSLGEFFAAPTDSYEVSESTRYQWVSNISYWDSVFLGQVLFPTSAFKGAGKKDPGLQPKLAKSRREFVSLVPGLVRSLENLGLETIDPTTWAEEFLLIRLIPSIKDDLPVPFEVLPDLEIRIFFDQENQTTSIRDVRLVRRNELDLLLPENTMDIRFVRRACVYSRKGNLDNAIETFIQNSNLDIWGFSRLRTPSTLSLRIPPHSLGPIADGRSSAAIDGEPVEYTFASLEHRSEIGVPFRQEGSFADLTYTSIEAGKMGGRRDELGLRQPKRTKNTTSQDEHIDSIDHAAEEDQEQNPTTDSQHSASLLLKANVLINNIENPTPNPSEPPKKSIHGLGSASRELHRANLREERAKVREAQRAAKKARAAEKKAKVREAKLAAEKKTRAAEKKKEKGYPFTGSPVNRSGRPVDRRRGVTIQKIPDTPLLKRVE